MTETEIPTFELIEVDDRILCPACQDYERKLLIEPAGDVPGDASTTEIVQAGDQVQEELSPSNDQDWYRLQLGADEEVSISIEPLSGDLVDARIEIATLGGTVLETREIGDANPLLFSQAAAGEVFLRVIGNGTATGDYRLVIDPALPPQVRLKRYLYTLRPCLAGAGIRPAITGAP